MGAMNQKGGCDAHQKNATHVKEVGGDSLVVDCSAAHRAAPESRR